MYDKLLFAACAVALVSGCNCNQPASVDGGTDAGDSVAVPSQLTMDEYCAAAGAGYRSSTKAETKVCGIPILDTDWEHLEFLVESPFGPQQIPFPRVWAGSDCSVDAGLRQQMAQFAASVSAGRLAYDGAAALACQSAGRDGGFSAFDSLGNLQGACASAWTPKVLLGGACEASYECVVGHFCMPSAVGACTGTCVPLHGVGDACSDREPCAAAFYCAEAADGGAGRCAAKLGPGDDCSGKGAPECALGLLCHGEAGAETCMPQAKLGQACLRVVETGSNCAEGTCVATLDTDSGVTSGMGVCQAAATIGEACGSGTDGRPRCDSCADCRAGADAGRVCVLRGQAGFGCEADTDCLDARFYYCDAAAAKCKFKPRTGQSCARFENSEGDVPARGSCLFADEYCSVIGGLDVGSPGSCKALPHLGEGCGKTPEFSAECESGYCRVTDGGSLGACAALPVTNERCASQKFGYGDCALSADYCDKRPQAGAPSATVGLCRPKVVLGQPCGRGVTCVSGLLCRTPADGGAEACLDLLPAGAPCADGRECSSGYCPDPSEGATAVCVVKKATNVACLQDAECESDSCDSIQKVCVSSCEEVLSNDSGGCMRYDLGSMTNYLTFSVLLGIMIFPRRRRSP